MYNEEDYRKILNNLAFNKDRRKPPDNRRKARFIFGWKNATLREIKYEDKTFKLGITWENLGNHFGWELEDATESEIDKVYEFLEKEYEKS